MYPENIGPYLSIDETVLSKGELYIIITNKRAKGKRKSIIAIFSGTKVESIVKKLRTIPTNLRNNVKEITLDIASSMKKIVSNSFPNAVQVTDRFHVQKLALDALQNIRIDFRWQALELENTRIQQAKDKGQKYFSKSIRNSKKRTD